VRVGKLRWLASALLGCVPWIVPDNCSEWTDAMSAELTDIDSDSEAVKFALGCIWAAFVIAGQGDLDDLPGQGGPLQNITEGWRRNPRTIGLICGLSSIALGIAYLTLAGAPFRYIVVNFFAAVIGVGCFVATNKGANRSRRMTPGVFFGLASFLLGATIFGVAADGASRWLRVGSMTLQPSLILLPAMVVAFSQRRSVIATVSIILVACALALQPDRAMAGVLAGGMIFLAVKVRDRLATAAAGFAMAGFCVALYRPDSLPAVPYVDRILFTAFDLSLAAGCAVVLGAGLLMLPGLLMRTADHEALNAYRIHALVWLAIVAAAAIGSYPTPLVCYGGSAIVGYFLSLALLPTPLASAAFAGSAATNTKEEHREDNPPIDSVRGRLVAVCVGAFGIRTNQRLATRGS
jgi:hypothetical protein